MVDRLGSGVHTLLPGMSVMYTWDDPAQDRQMEVMIDDFKKGKTRVRIGPKVGINKKHSVLNDSGHVLLIQGMCVFACRDPYYLYPLLTPLGW